MTGDARKFLMFTAAAAAIALASGTTARALSFDDIAGRWCGSMSRYTFTPSRLIVEFYADNSRSEFTIDDYLYEGGVITLNWQRGDDKLFTKFSEFDDAIHAMVQLPNAAGPRREFRRCSPALSPS